MTNIKLFIFALSYDNFSVRIEKSSKIKKVEKFNNYIFI